MDYGGEARHGEKGKQLTMGAEQVLRVKVGFGRGWVDGVDVGRGRVIWFA